MAFSSHPKVLATLMGPAKVRGHEVALLSLENYRGRFVFIPKVSGDLFFNNNRNVLVLKCE